MPVTFLRRLLAPAAISMMLVLPARSALQKARDDLAVTAPGQSVLVDVLGNDGALGPGLRILKAFKPAHGSVAVENGRVRYTPAAGYQGSDSFRYMAQSGDDQPGQATVSVEVGRGGVALRLAGRVVDEAIPYATVKVSIGGFDFITRADADGNYVLDVAALHGDDFVTLSASGTSASGAAVRFYSAVGEMVRLAAAAGSDGVLVRDESNQVNVTNLSTAQYTLLADANGGTPVTSDQQLLPLVQNIDLDKMLQLAAVIKLVVDGNVPLPAGTTDALALISDPAALSSFVTALPAGELDAAIDAVVQDPNLTPAFRVGNVPASYALVSPSAPGTIRVGLSGIPILYFDNIASSAGTGRLVDQSAASGADFTWSLQDGDIVMEMQHPYTWPTYDADAHDALDCAGFGPVRITETFLRARLHRLQDGAGVDYVEYTETGYRQAVDLDPADACAVPPDGEVSASARRLAFEDGTGELPFTPGEALGRIALGTYVPSTDATTAVILDFDANHAEGSEFLGPFTWSIVNGRLRFALTDAGSGQQVQYEYRRYQSDGRKGEGMFMVATLPGGAQVANYVLTARADATGVFTDPTMAGVWRSGFDISQFQGDGTRDIGFFIVLNPDLAHTGNQRSVDAFGTINNAFLTWSVEANQMVARGYREIGRGSVSSCISPDPMRCWQVRERRWIPLARDGNRVYVLESISFRNGPTDPMVIGPNGGRRMNFYEVQ